ncbi:hypothetical protein J45TS6_12790 [Paenibacillus sp. J45TS6]|uniref:DUF4179 domain-containing protein n=1 Tax=Paenibacillus sp. J45TS6 TaxID=2807196 RepID=UPI001AFED139|nr:DUF4179 domain-containing protein [Paenibacillus sp. J45TS6]GIP42820.1 hypothetical protein J45TS6_12790 [Paenibacillus sp. J45TS6]
MKDEVEEQNVAQMMKKVSNDSSKSQFPELDTEKLPRDRKKPRNRLSKRLFYITGFTVVFLLAILVLERNGVSEEERIVMEKLSGKLGYLKLIREDQTLYNAVKHDLLQDLHMTDTDGDYSLTVDGLIADEKKVVMLYTLTAPNQASRKDSFLRYEILDGKKNHLSSFSHAAPLSVYDKEKAEKVQVDARLLDISWSPEGGTTPDTLILNVELDDKKFSMTIPNDQSRYVDMKKTYQLEEALTIGDQKLTVHEAVVTPLVAYVRISADSLNTRNINGMISLAIMNEEGKHYPSGGGSGDLMSPEGLNARFISNYFDSLPAFLVSEGAYISDKNKKLVINTDTKETLLAPSEHIALSEAIVKDEEIEITILTKDIDVPTPKEYRNFMLLSTNTAFTDSTGTEFMILDDSRSGFNSNGEKAEQTLYYSIPKEDYEQPLTFEVEEYPGFVKEKVKIMLDSK